MEIKNVTKEEYKTIVTNPFSRFDTVEFAELNKHKVDKVFYFIFNNGKNRFGLVGGLKDNVLKFPFSATFSCFSEITTENRTIYYQEAVNSLLIWAENNNIRTVEFNTPPLFYDIAHITKLQNALYNNGFKIKVCDINFEYYLEEFNGDYLSNIHRNARKNYNNALKHNLIFQKTDDVETVYNVIKINRSHRGFPLWMSLEDVIKTSDIIESDYFVVKSNDGIAYASALVHNLKENIVRVVYWGNTPESEEVRPINFLSYNLLNYYKKLGKKVVDIGTATLDSVPNYGLCDFKESIGCKCSPKLSFEKEIK